MIVPAIRVVQEIMECLYRLGILQREEFIHGTRTEQVLQGFPERAVVRVGGHEEGVDVVGEEEVGGDVVGGSGGVDLAFAVEEAGTYVSTRVD